MPTDLLHKYYNNATLLSQSPYGNLYMANSRRTKLNVIARLIELTDLTPEIIKQLEEAHLQTKRIHHTNIFNYTAFHLAGNTVILETESNEQTVVDDIGIRHDLGANYRTDELFFFAYQIADALAYIQGRTVYESLPFSVRGDSVIIKSNPLNLADMHARLSIFTVKWGPPSTNKQTTGPLCADDIFDLKKLPANQRFLLDVVQLGYLLLEMALMRPVENGTGPAVCAENEEAILQAHGRMFLDLVHLCINYTTYRRTITSHIRDLAAAGLGLHSADRDLRLQSLREKAYTASKWIKQVKLEKRLLKPLEAREVIQKIIAVGMIAERKGLHLNYSPAHVRMVNQYIIVYPSPIEDKPIVDFLRELINVIEPTEFSRELAHILAIKGMPPNSVIVSKLEPVLAIAGPMETHNSVKDIVLESLFKHQLAGLANSEALYMTMFDKALTRSDAAQVIEVLPELQRKPVLLGAFMRCCVERSILPRIPFRFGVLRTNMTRLMTEVLNNRAAPVKDSLAEIGQQCLSPIGLHDKTGCKVFYTCLTALMIAAWYNRIGTLRLLLGELGYYTNNSMTALMFAAIADNPDAASLLLMECGCRNSQGQTALMLATIWQHIAVVKVLAPLEAGLRDKCGQTALMYAVQEDSADIVKYLARFETRYQDNDGKTALIHSVHRGSKAYVQILMKGEATLHTLSKMTALFFAVRDNKPELVELLLQYEGHVVDANNATVLMLAAKMGDKGLVQYIMENAEMLVGMTNHNGWTALMEAAFFGHASVAKILAPREGKCRNGHGHTALMIAAQNNNARVVRALLEYEGKVRDSDGETALMHAARRNSIESVTILKRIEAGVTNNSGHTALMIAIKEGHTTIVGELFALEHNIKNRHGLSAVDLAYATQHRGILHLIEERLERG